MPRPLVPHLVPRAPAPRVPLGPPVPGAGPGSAVPQIAAQVTPELSFAQLWPQRNFVCDSATLGFSYKVRSSQFLCTVIMT